MADKALYHCSFSNFFVGSGIKGGFSGNNTNADVIKGWAGTDLFTALSQLLQVSGQSVSI